MRFGLVIGYIAHVQLIPTINYSAIADSHTLLLTMAHTKTSMSALGVAWQQIPTMSSDSVFHGSGPYWLASIIKLLALSTTSSYITSAWTPQ
jgi:biotin transporter BioY